MCAVRILMVMTNIAVSLVKLLLSPLQHLRRNFSHLNRLNPAIYSRQIYTHVRSGGAHLKVRMSSNIVLIYESNGVSRRKSFAWLLLHDT